jgi:nucleoid DNA-binding protein
MKRTGMKREELARTLARRARVSSATARDQVDELVHGILEALRGGRPVELPGVGKLVASANVAHELIPSRARRSKLRGRR